MCMGINLHYFQASIPSVHALVCHCHLTWKKAWLALLHTNHGYGSKSLSHSSSSLLGGPEGLALHQTYLFECSVIGPLADFFRPFPISEVINPAAVLVHFPHSMRIHLTFQFFPYQTCQDQEVVPPHSSCTPAHQVSSCLCESVVVCF